IVFIILAAVIISSALLSFQIMKPINRMIQNMKRVEEGVYLPVNEDVNSLEFNNLTHAYNVMILKIKRLIKEVYLAEIKQNESKFLALQAQINPHWLYNTLESIRMKAELSGNHEVAAMIKTLGRLFHMALSKSAAS